MNKHNIDTIEKIIHIKFHRIYTYCIMVEELTDGIFNEDHFVCFDERTHSNDILSSNSEKVAFLIQQTLDHSIVAGDSVGDRGIAHTV